MMTEEEARKKWCPFVRQSNGPDGTWNRFNAASHVSDLENYTCLGSGCMAWRSAWEEHPDAKMLRYEKQSIALYGDAPKPKDGEGWEPVKHKNPNLKDTAEPFIDHWRRRVGFCGLAGNPRAPQ